MRKTSDVLWQDAQHQVLFEILDSISEPGADGGVLARLRDYTETHFALEELYMEQLSYPDRESHVRTHDKFRQEIDKLLHEGQEHDPLFMGIISTFLTEWLTCHVFGVDKDLEKFLLQADVK
ncbi:MAG: hemerythrin family protein [Proteobacteria bacterium]|nr:hemerythrin family protein [Pseudomonadota bacterium]